MRSVFMIASVIFITIRDARVEGQQCFVMVSVSAGDITLETLLHDHHVQDLTKIFANAWQAASLDIAARFM